MVKFVRGNTNTSMEEIRQTKVGDVLFDIAGNLLGDIVEIRGEGLFLLSDESVVQFSEGIGIVTLSTKPKPPEPVFYDECCLSKPMEGRVLHGNIWHMLEEMLVDNNYTIDDLVKVYDGHNCFPVSAFRSEMDKYHLFTSGLIETFSSDFEDFDFDIYESIEHNYMPNPDLKFILKDNNFIDFKQAHSCDYDGGHVVITLRFNDINTVVE